MPDRPPFTVEYDAEIFLRQRHGGVSSLFAALYAGLAARPDLDVLPRLGFTRTSNAHLQEACRRLGQPLPSERPRTAHPHQRLLDAPNPVASTWITYLAGGRPRSDHRLPDVWHSTWYRRPPVTAPARPWVVSVHDFIPEDFYGRPRMHRGKDAAIADADLVFCLTDTVCDDVLARYPGTRIAVVPPIVTTRPPATADRTALPTAAPYVVFVGSRLPHKGFGTLVRAVRRARSAGSDLGLVVVGPPLTSDEARVVHDAAPSDRVTVVEHADEATRDAVVAGAACLSMPSAAEGFGIPVLEAMRLGTPVVTSDIPVLREVAGSAALVHPVSDADALAEQVVGLLGSPSLRDDLVRAGHDRCDHYAPERALAIAAAAYRSLT